MFYRKHVFHVRLWLLGASVYKKYGHNWGKCLMIDKGLFTKIFYDQSFWLFKEEHSSDSGKRNICTEYW